MTYISKAKTAKAFRDEMLHYYRREMDFAERELKRLLRQKENGPYAAGVTKRDIYRAECLQHFHQMQLDFLSGMEFVE